VLPEVIARQALATPSRLALKFLIDGERDSLCLSYGELAARAHAIAQELTRRDLTGHPVVLLYPPGPDYLCALLGCFWAGAIAVPAYPPGGQRLSRAAERVATLVVDAGARAALTSGALAELLGKTPELAQLECLATDSWRTPDLSLSVLDIDPDQPCLLQYTSGSTSTPKGVLVTHSQLVANLEIISAASSPRIDGPVVTWLPPYHDMGLIGTLLHPLHRGDTIVQLSPESFIRKPIRWLRAISEHRATKTATPNFAFDLCLRRIPIEQRAGLDLSSMRLVVTGSEPIDGASLEAFAQAFEPYGLKREALCPCYGMAEATLMLSANAAPRPASIRSYDAAALEQGHARPCVSDARSRTLVGCGPAQPHGALRIVDPQRCTEVSAGGVGEIWAMSPSVASGYWHRPEETQATFHARIADTQEGPFLRTGDLGFMDGEELFITGRLKNSIIIRGKKHFPQDIERTVQRLDPALTADAGAAFAIDIEGTERLCVVQELDHRLQPDMRALLQRIPGAILEQHEIAVHAILLVKRGSIHKTSSGKIKRHSMKDAFLESSLPSVARWDAAVAPECSEPRAGQCMAEAMQVPVETVRQTHTRLVTGERRATAIEGFLREKIAARAKLRPADLNIDAPLAEYGVDSLIATEVAEELEAWLEMPVPSTISYDHPTIRGLSRALAGVAPARGAGAAAAEPRPVALPAPDATDAIAIVGMACRFPGADDLQTFWRLLQEGRDAIGEVPKTRWDAAALCQPGPERPGSLSSRFGGFIDDIEQFDAAFFGISPREASRMDPQQRLFMEVVWQALEDAGIAPDSLAGSDSGVFAAVCGSDHALLHAGDLNRVDADFGTGHAASIVPNRVSYFLDLKGPSLAYDSACSSALVALSAACQSLANGETQLAIVGGVNAVLAPHAGVFFSNARALARDGRCKTFDKHADGFVRSEGCGVIVLQRLPQALAQRNHVYALVAGSAAAHGGASNGLMAPNGPAQERVIRSALARARLSPDALDYIEAHGVGSRVADTVELRALGAVLKSSTREAPCWVGSVKTNLGHLEAASGMASVIKTALALTHEEIPQNLHLRELHPDIAQNQLPLAVPTRPIPWRRCERPRHAGVSAFGLGGTNAHVVLSEAARHRVAGAPDRATHLLTLSATSPAALVELCTRWAHALADVSLGDACFTANAGRKHFCYRAAFVASSNTDMRAALLGFEAPAPDLRVANSPAGVALVFSDRAGTPASGRELYQTQPVFRRAYDQASRWLEPDLGVPVHPQSSHVSATPECLTGLRLTGHGLALQYALFELLREWRLLPVGVCGQGAGEYLAACAAGVLDWSDGLRLALRRTQLLASLVPGAEVVRSLRQFKLELSQTAQAPARLPLVLASRSEVLRPHAELEPDHWLRQVYQSHAEPAQAVDGSALGLETDLYLELGGSDQAAVRAHPWHAHAAQRGGDPQEPDGDCLGLLQTLAALYARGVEIDWQAFDRPFGREKLSLPTYPFERKYCWLEPPGTAKLLPLPAAATQRSPHPLLQRMTSHGRQPAAGGFSPSEPHKDTG
jgi:acyl transferase domain-containing protein/acyl-CoA synthetase (AMP-forming)/AMP-acid ligase II